MRKKIGLPNFKRRSRTSCDENEEDDEIKICADYFSINLHSSKQVWAETVKLTGQLNRLWVDFGNFIVVIFADEVGRQLKHIRTKNIA